MAGQWTRARRLRRAWRPRVLLYAAALGGLGAAFIISPSGRSAFEVDSSAAS